MIVGFHEAVLIAEVRSVATAVSPTVVSVLRVVEAAMVSCAESELLEHAVKKRPAESERKSEPIVIFFL